MGLSLKQANAVQALAAAVQDFLPGSGARQWAKHVTFGTVADRVGVGEFWARQGSKVPRLVHLFENTLLRRPECFEPLIVDIVKEGLRYRTAGSRRITTDEVRVINGLILEIGFKFPALWEEGFLNALVVDDVTRAQRNVEEARREDEYRSSSGGRLLQGLGEMRHELERLSALDDRQAAGYALENLLNRLFEVAGLAPRQPFKLVGEQIDGSFDLDHETYLLEAKWGKSPTQANDLYVFREKVGGKSAFTHGVFIAMNGITAEAEQAIKTGKQAVFFVMTGHDLMMVLLGGLPLDEFIRRRQRLLAEEAAVLAMFDRVKG